MTVWQHKKRGTTYRILHDNVLLQCSTAPDFEEDLKGATWTVYQSTETGAVYVRLTKEFHDGRFERFES